MPDAPQPVFEQPWHAQLFALSVALHARGEFTWSEWTKRFGAQLKKNGAGQELNGGDDYFAAWLDTLEAFLVERNPKDRQQLSALRAAWKEAYLSTPHGSPVDINIKK